MKQTKKLLALLLAVVMVCTTLPLALAEDGDATIYGTDGPLVWTLDNKGVLTINGEGAMRNRDSWSNSSDYYGTYAWGSYRGAITKVVIKNGVTNIGSYAFSGCSSLTSVTIPDSVTSIGSYAFSGCTALPAITIPDSVTSIGSDAFRNCTALPAITIPDSVTSIENSAFSGCTALASVTLPDRIPTIQAATFYNCYSLTSITIPDSVTSIGYNAFYNCDGLTSITLPDSVTSIGERAFYYCDGLTSVTIPDSVTSIGGSAFYSCDRLTSVTIGSGVTTIGSDAFNYSPITRVDISDLAAWCKISFGNNYANPLGSNGGDIYLNGALLETVDVPEGVSTINAYAFYNCKSIKTVTLPITVGSIGPDAFRYCSNLESVTILNGLCTIADSATAISPTAVISGYDDTEAQAYAEKYDRTFVSLGAYTHEHTPVVHEEPGTCRTKGFRLTTCSVCGEQLSYEPTTYGDHQFGEWYYNYSSGCTMYYYRYCSVCDTRETKTEEAHNYYVYSRTGSCTEGCTVTYRCSNCGTTKAETFESMDHDYEVYTKGLCTEPHDVIHRCTRCGNNYTEHEEGGEHTFGEPKVDERCGGRIEYYSCALCGYSYEEVVTEPNHDYAEVERLEPYCGNKGYVVYICSNCGDKRTEGLPPVGEHEFVSEGIYKCYDAGHDILLRCRICDATQIRSDSHNFCDWIVDREATCAQSGHQYRVCEDCGWKEDQTLPATGEHNFVFSHYDKWSEEEHGVVSYCSGCGLYNRAPEAHTYGDWTEGAKPTCTKNGYDYRVCEVCGYQTNRSVPATGHTFGPWSRFVMADDAANEVEIRFCNTCGYYELRQAGTHDPVDPTEPTDPTNPTDPTDPSNPTDPTDPSNPTDPTDPSNPTDPTDPSNPTDPTDPTEPTNPTNPTEPTEPTTEPSAENEQNEAPQGFFAKIGAFFRNLFDKIFGIFRR